MALIQEPPANKLFFGPKICESPVNTIMSIEQWTELSDEVLGSEITKDLFADGLTPQPIDDATMDLRQGLSPAIRPRGKKAGAACRVGSLLGVA
jgi:hypothetical protein